MTAEFQNFHVGLKAFIAKGDQVLVVREKNGGLWEVPGGRIDVGEEKASVQNVLLREISEELGPNFMIVINQPFYSWMRKWTPPQVGYVYLTGFRCAYISGDITISDEHTEARWISREEVDILDFAPGYKEALLKYWE